MNAPVEVKMLRSIDLALPEIPNLPEPLKVRRAQISDAEKIATLCGHGYIGEIWDKKSTEIELFHDKTIKAVLLVTLKTRLVACLLYTSPSPRDRQKSRMPSSA